MAIRIARSIAEVDATQWNALGDAGTPFLRHEFLLALEDSGCATAATGWEANHVLLHGPDGKMSGALPLYLKSHSWGEFVFDFAWADAYHRAGLRYYPRLVSAVPFTPATGPRLLAADDASRSLLLQAARDQMRTRGASSLHLLFPPGPDREFLTAAGLMPRLDCQFHWRNEGYGSFDDFLSGFTAEKRKKLKRERRRVAEAGIECRTLRGGDLDEAMLDTVYRLHAMTFARYGHAPYLNRDFFSRIASTMQDALVIELATLHGKPIACAVSLRGCDALYGRYWGAKGEYHSLHFELCYYRGIEYCIRERLARFEPGTQGEHKLLRGFVPTPVWSLHEIADARFGAAIGDWLRKERRARRDWLREAVRHLPFRRDDIPARLGPDVRDCLAAED
ncbi:MAG TPA: GNAT family N-acetyltransferase [Steroidobacteraceae bacterium]